MHQAAIISAEMHAIPLAEVPHITVRAWACMHPLTITIGLELILPHVGELVFIDISLMISTSDAQATGNGAIGKNGSHIDTSLTTIRTVAHL